MDSIVEKRLSKKRYVALELYNSNHKTTQRTCIIKSFLYKVILKLLLIKKDDSQYVVNRTGTPSTDIPSPPCRRGTGNYFSHTSEKDRQSWIQMVVCIRKDPDRY